MISRIFDGLQNNELPLDAGVYQLRTEGDNTGLLHFRVDWSNDNVNNIKHIVIYCLKPIDFGFLQPAGIDEEFNYLEDKIILEVKDTETVKFIPFVIRKKIILSQTYATFKIKLLNNNGVTRRMNLLSISL